MNSAPVIEVPLVITQSPSAVSNVLVPLVVRMPMMVAIGMIRMMRNAVVTRLSCSG